MPSNLYPHASRPLFQPLHPWGGPLANPEAEADADSGATPDPVQKAASGGDPSAAELEALKTQIKELQDRQTAPRDEVTPNVEAFRKLKTSFQRAGYTPQQAEGLATAVMAGDVQDDEGDLGEYTASRGAVDPDEDAGPDPRDVELANLRRQVAEIHGSQQKNQLAQLQERLTNSVKSALDENKGLAKILASVPEDRRAKLMARWEKKLQAETRQLLAERRQKSGGGWDMSWMAEEARKAADVTYEEFRSVIPEPSRLGHAGETVAEAEEFLKRKPVEAPTWKPGMGPAETTAAFKNFALDSLLRGDAESRRGASKA